MPEEGLLDGQRGLGAGVLELDTPGPVGAEDLCPLRANLLHMSPHKLDERPQLVVVIAILFFRERERRLDNKDAMTNWIRP